MLILITILISVLLQQYANVNHPTYTLFCVIFGNPDICKCYKIVNIHTDIKTTTKTLKQQPRH